MNSDAGMGEKNRSRDGREQGHRLCDRTPVGGAWCCCGCGPAARDLSAGRER
jgi:hypothetical protein